MATSTWDISTGTYASKSMSVGTQETDPYGLAFSSDGMKAYAIGTINDTVYQYTLSAAWDISTGTYASKSMSVATQDSTPYGLSFSSDGTKAYVVGSTSKTIYQYTISTAWDISTGSYASKSLLVSGQEIIPIGIAFSSDGTKCYIVGNANNTVYQYTLSTPWDISTGTYASKSMSVAAQDTGPRGLALSSDGTKVYVLGEINNTIFQYILSTPWDISTGSYSSKSLLVSAQENAVKGLAFSFDGLRFYILGTTNQSIFQYSLGLIYELTGTVKDPSGAAIANADVFIVQSSAGEVTTITYDNIALEIAAQESSVEGVDFSADGTKCYIVGTINTAVYQYDLSTAWDISTATYAAKSMSVAAQNSTPEDLRFSSDGTKCYIMGAVGNTVYQYTLSVAWDISTGSYASKSMSVAAQESNAWGLGFSADGTKCYIVGVTNDTVYQYTLSTAWDISSGTYASKTLITTGLLTWPVGVTFSADGTKCYIVGLSKVSVAQYDLSTPWDVSTGVYNFKIQSVQAQDTAPTGIDISSDGTKLYICGRTGDKVYQYTFTNRSIMTFINADGSGNYTYTSPAIETDLQVITSTVGPPRRFGASDNNLSTS